MANYGAEFLSSKNIGGTSVVLTKWVFVQATTIVNFFLRRRLKKTSNIRKMARSEKCHFLLFESGRVYQI